MKFIHIVAMGHGNSKSIVGLFASKQKATEYIKMNNHPMYESIEIPYYDGKMKLDDLEIDPEEKNEVKYYTRFEHQYNINREIGSLYIDRPHNIETYAIKDGDPTFDYEQHTDAAYNSNSWLLTNGYIVTDKPVDDDVLMDMISSEIEKLLPKPDKKRRAK